MRRQIITIMSVLEPWIYYLDLDMSALVSLTSKTAQCPFALWEWNILLWPTKHLQATVTKEVYVKLLTWHLELQTVLNCLSTEFFILVKHPSSQEEQTKNLGFHCNVKSLCRSGTCGWAQWQKHNCIYTVGQKVHTEARKLCWHMMSSSHWIGLIFPSYI